MVTLTPKNFAATVANGITLVEFSGDWCAPCQALAPVLQAAAEQVRGQVKIATVDVGKYRELATEYAVQNLPTMLLFVNGTPQEKIAGYRPLTPLVTYLKQRAEYYNAQMN